MANPLNIINEIQAPDLTNENLSASLKEVFEKINDNFKKIISAPIYRGQKGESVRIEPVTLFDEGTNTFTEEGQKLVKVIFDIDFTDWTGGKANLDEILEDDPRYKKIGGVYASDYFKSNTSILMFQLDDVARTNLTPAQIYAFQDKRVGYLTGQDVNFVDTSCFISFEWVGDTYNYVKINEFPTIQWSNSVNDYVWSINGQQTNIIAKGLKGMDASFTLPLFMVVDRVDYWEVTGVKQGDFIIEITDETFPWDEYSVGMGCVAYITVDDVITGLDISSIRQINREGTTLSINKSGADIEAKQLVTMLGEIRPFRDNVVSNSNPPALFIPAGVTDLEDHFHALWRNTGTGTDCKDLHMGYSKIVNNEIKPGEEWANLTLHGYNAIYFDESNDYVENPLPDNPPIPNIKLNNGILEVSSGGTNRSGFNLGPNNISMSSNNVTVTSPLIDLTVNNPDNPGFINIKPGEITASANTFTLTGSNFYLKSSSSIIPTLQVDGNKIMLRNKSIIINSNFTSPNDIFIGNGGQSNIQISGKNINLNEYPYGKLSDIKTNVLTQSLYQVCDLKYNVAPVWTAGAGELKMTLKFYVRDGVGYFKFNIPEAIKPGNTPQIYESNEEGEETLTYDVYQSKVARVQWDVTDIFTDYKPAVSEYYACGIYLDDSVGIRDGRSVVGYLFKNSSGNIILKLKYVAPYILDQVVLKSRLAQVGVAKREHFVKKASFQYSCACENVGDSIGEGYVTFPVVKNII